MIHLTISITVISSYCVFVIISKALNISVTFISFFSVQRVRQTALVLARSSTRAVDLLVVELAALFHDLLDRKYVSQEVASNAASFFESFYESMSCYVNLIKDGRAALITKIVENVSWSTEKRLRESGSLTDWHNDCVELHCVQDADRLDAIGAFGACIFFRLLKRTHFLAGIMRCAAFSCVANRPLHVPAGDKNENSTAIAHFYDKLLKVKYRLKTDLGKNLGEERHRLVRQYSCIFTSCIHKRPDGTLSGRRSQRADRHYKHLMLYPFLYETEKKNTVFTIWKRVLRQCFVLRILVRSYISAYM